MESVEVVNAGGELGEGGDQGLQLLRSWGLRVLVSSGTDQSWSSQLRGRTPAAGKSMYPASKD
jgi:hypothetical protein